MGTTTTQELVEHHFKSFAKQHYSSLSRADAWEIFTSHLALKQFKIEQADVVNGIVDGKFDGGIDSFHTILNLTESVTLRTRGIKSSVPSTAYELGVPLDVVVTQAKSDTGWDQNAVWKLRETLDRLMDHSVTLNKLFETPLNQAVVDQTDALRRVERKIMLLNPKRSFTVLIMSNTSELAIHKHLKNSMSDLKSTVSNRLPHGTKVDVRFAGSETLLTMIQQEANFDGMIKFSKPPIREARRTSQAFLGLVTVKDYLAFLRRPGSKVLRDEFFGVNVRDFAGDRNPVNSAIRRTLSADSDTAFWWMNNGITILSDSATEPINDSWLLKNPQIVNGLQTSHVLHASEIALEITKKRLLETVLVRVVTEKNPQIRESIITGTNNQTNVGTLQLYANDDVQRKIEAYLLTKGWFYERRRWQYRGSNTPASKIKSIGELGQAVIATRLLRPDTARARPASLLSKTAGYNSVFSSSTPEPVYSKSLELVATVEKYLRSPEAKKISDNFTNDRYYVVAGHVVSNLKLKDLRKFSLDASIHQLDSRPTSAQLNKVHAALYDLVSDPDDTKKIDALFKGSDLRAQLFRALGVTSVE